MSTLSFLTLICDGYLICSNETVIVVFAIAILNKYL